MHGTHIRSSIIYDLLVFFEGKIKDKKINTGEPRHKKTNVLVSNLVRHKPGCTATEDDKRLEILDLGSRGIVLSV